MAFDPPSGTLACAACGQRRGLPEADRDAMARAHQEHDARTALREAAAPEAGAPARIVDCPSCGAQTQLEGHVVGARCAFFATPLLLERAHDERRIAPQAMLPFALDRERARQVFQAWVASRWFAPDALRRTVREPDGIQGVYTPWWTFDALAICHYEGERGHRRREPEPHPGATARAGAGQRTVIDWERVSGVVEVRFDDLLVVGSPSVPAHLARVLDGWDLGALQPVTPERLAGFTVEVYRQGLEPSFEQARERMEPALENAVRQAIGGDDQRVLARDTRLHDIRFKHLLLPVWVGSYRFGKKAYQVVVNGRSGEVEGERPYSATKIALAVLGALALLVLFRCTTA
jgi:hypothetical protein